MWNHVTTYRVKNNTFNLYIYGSNLNKNVGLIVVFFFLVSDYKLFVYNYYLSNNLRISSAVRPSLAFGDLLAVKYYLLIKIKTKHFHTKKLKINVVFYF